MAIRRNNIKTKRLQMFVNGLHLNVKVFHRGYLRIHSMIIPDVIILLVCLCNSECGFCCQAWQLAEATQLSQLR